MARDKKKNSDKKRKPFRISDYIDPLYIKVMIGAVILMSLISMSLIIVNQVKINRAAYKEQEEMIAFQEGLSKSFSLLSLSDFILPEQYGLPENHIYLQREPHSLWTEEEVARFWIPIEDTGLKDLTQSNKALIKQLLGEDSP